MSFKEPEYTVNEDGVSVNVCVLLSIPSSETVTVELSSQDESAVAGDSHVAFA